MHTLGVKTHCSFPTPASKCQRKKLLEWFQSRFQLAPFSGELESECGANVSLFLARVLVWMQKTTAPHVVPERLGKRFFALSEQLACVQIFLASANAHMYFREFQQANGLAVLLTVLRAGAESTMARAVSRGEEREDIVSDDDRQVVLGILCRVSQRGRAHKEEVSRCEGELVIVCGTLAGSARCSNMASPLWEACRDALLEQMVGNPNCPNETHTAVAFMLGHAETKLRVFGAQVRPEWLVAAASASSLVGLKDPNAPLIS